jgi:hypothetical protein
MGLVIAAADAPERLKNIDAVGRAIDVHAIAGRERKGARQ